MEESIKEIMNNPTISNLVLIFLGITVIWILIKFIQNKFIGKIKAADNRHRTKKLTSFIGYFLTVILIITVYSDSLGGFGVALGVAGAGIAFALQEVITSVAGWLAIVFGNFYKTGDRVQLGGIKGDVMDIGVLRTTLMEVGQWVNGDLYNGRIVRISNSFVFKEPVFNYSADFPFLWDEMRIPLKTESDYKYAKDTFLTIMEESLGDFTKNSQNAWNKMTQSLYVENAQITPMVSMSFDESWMTFTLRYIVNYKMRRTTKDMLYIKILEAIKASNGKLKIASAAIEVTNMNKN
ncbi:mechanosensitive ion channel family protein [Roseivirga echinicomitans]|uniref:Transporter n=1 Tax=Roseivirga echinicomitans TaxID=296218 RepID=A0A150XQ90_9BACT|nr:mechanosensitive ion channel domain-containing protein [Roseivirga echinicomitans]KYG80752.1 transporter [Roseivirga echinicomitans]